MLFRANFWVSTSLAAASCLLSVQAQTAPLSPHQSNAQFAQAVSLRDAGDLDRAIDAFEHLLAADGSLDRARLELAVSHFRALNFSQAQALAEHVLAQPTTPETVKITIRQFLTEVEKASRPHVFTPFVNVGMLYDSNVNAGPSTDVIDINGSSFRLNGSSVQARDMGTVAMAGIAHRYLFPTKLSLGGRKLTGLWQSQASYYRTSYDTASANDLDVLSLSTGPALLDMNKWRLVLPYQMSYISLGGSHLATYHGLQPTWITNTHGWELGVNGQWQQRNYVQNGHKNRNSIYTAMGGYASRNFLQQKLTAHVDAHAFEERAHTERFSNRGEILAASLTVRPWRGGEVTLRGSRRASRYRGEEVLYGFARRDQENRISLSVGHTFGDGLMDKWNLTLVGSQMHNQSNISIYDYRRKQVAVNLGRSF